MLAHTAVHRTATLFRVLFFICVILVVVAIGYTGWVVFRYWTVVTV